MATPVQITVTLDPSGAVTGAKQLGAALDGIGNQAVPMGKKGEDSFNGIERATRRAHIAGQLFVRTTGIEIPRALERVMAHSALAGPIMAAAFPLMVGTAFLPVLVRVGEKFNELIQSAGGYTEALRKVHEETVKASEEAFINPKTLEDARKHLNEINTQVEKLHAADVAGYKQQHEAQVAFMMAGGLIKRDEAERVVSLNEEAAAKTRGVKLEEHAVELTGQQRDLQLSITKLTKEETSALQTKSDAIGLIGKKGFALIAAEHQNAINEINRNVGMGPAMKSGELANADAKAAAQILELRRQNAQETMLLQDKVAENALTGIAKIKKEEEDEVGRALRLMAQKDGLSQAEVQKTAQYQAKVAEIHQQAYQKIKQSKIALDDQIFKSQEFVQQRADSFLAGTDKIIADAKRETDALRHEQEKLEKEYGLSDARAIEIQLTDRLAAIEHQRVKEQAIYQKGSQEYLDVQKVAEAERIRIIAESNDRLRLEQKHLTEQLGSELESVFNDISSGNIGKRILANIEKLFFQIVAQWILSLGIMKSAAGSILGSIVFGPGSTGAGVFGGGPQGGGIGSLLGGILGIGGASSQSAQVSASGSSSFTLPGLGAGTGLSGALVGTGASAGSFSASNALTSSTMAAASGAGSSIGAGLSSAAGGKGGVLSGLFSAKGISGLAAALPSFLGGAFGGKAGQLGGLLGSLGLMAALNPASAAGTLMGAAGLSALAGPLAVAGLDIMSFGIGSSHGSVLGGIVGFLSGGLLGLFSGIGGGIFGGNKRKKQANAFYDNSVSPGIASVIQGFDSFQVNSDAALQQLEQLRTDAQKQLSALKGQGNDVFSHRVGPAIDDAEKHIRDIQTERVRRSSLVFGPPQFDTGGMFSMMRGNAGLAVLHDGEYVVNPRDTAKNRRTLENINAGGSGGFSMGDLHIHPQGALDRKYVMSRQFRKDLLDAMDQARREGEL